MIKTIVKVGNSQGIIFDQSMMELSHLKLGDEMAVSFHAGGSIILTPLRPSIAKEKVSSVIQETMKEYAQTMKKLA
jgi:antitoxin component of MazEF toxin-antitoxin module